MIVSADCNCSIQSLFTLLCSLTYDIRVVQICCQGGRYGKRDGLGNIVDAGIECPVCRADMHAG